MCLWSVAINRCDWHLKHWMNKRHTERVSVKWGRVEVVRFWPRMCAPNQFSVSSVFPVGSIWQPCSASWASARRWFAPKWQRERARSSWPTPFISSLLRRALASRWCRSHSSCAISGRLDSLSPQRLHPDDPPPPPPPFLLSFYWATINRWCYSLVIIWKRLIITANLGEWVRFSFSVELCGAVSV